MSKRDTYITVHEAAEFLGVVPNTIRAWGARGKIPEYRHPINGYRLYKPEDLKVVLQSLERSLKPIKKRVTKV